MQNIGPTYFISPQFSGCIFCREFDIELNAVATNSMDNMHLTFLVSNFHRGRERDDMTTETQTSRRYEKSRYCLKSGKVLRPNISETKFQDFFRYKLFPRPRPVRRLFMEPNFPILSRKKRKKSRKREFPGLGCHTLLKGCAVQYLKSNG